MNKCFHSILLILLMSARAAFAFLPSTTMTTASTPVAFQRYMAAATDDSDGDVVAKRIIVKGAVQGGYYRSCVLNEAGRFRSLIGTMSPPDDTDEAEIYVEGNKKMVDGFVRWCQRGNVGLNQITEVSDIIEEVPTGLYDGFYVKTR